MPAGRDIVLKIGSDIRDAIQGFQQVRRESEDTARIVDSSTSRIERTVSRIRASQVASAFRQGISTFAAGGSIADSLVAAAQADPRLATATAIIEGFSAIVNRLDGTASRLEKAQQELTKPTSVAADIESLSTVTKSGTGFSWAKVFRELGDVYTKGQFTFLPGVINETPAQQQRNREDWFRARVRANPGVALLDLDMLGHPDDLQNIWDEEAQKAKTAQTFQQSSAYQTAQREAKTAFGGATTINIYANLVRDPNGGQDLAAITNRYNRNNGRNATYTTSS